MGYQNLTAYNGSMYGRPSYSGIEYDFEVPDNLVVSSPGGVSSTHHYFNKGFYGKGSSTPDIYAGEGYRYPMGILGNAYQYGYDSATQLDIFDTPPDQMFTQNNSTPTIKEAFNGETRGTYEVVPPPESDESRPRKLRLKVNPWVLFLLFALASTAIVFLTYAVDDYIKMTFYKGQPLSWRGYAMFTVIFVFLLVVITSLTGTSLIELETL